MPVFGIAIIKHNYVTVDFAIEVNIGVAKHLKFSLMTRKGTIGTLNLGCKSLFSGQALLVVTQGSSNRNNINH